MSLRAVAVTLVWVGTGALLWLLLRRFARGSWSLEDEDVPVVSFRQKVIAALALLAAAAGLILFIWSWYGME